MGRTKATGPGRGCGERGFIQRKVFKNKKEGRLARRTKRGEEIEVQPGDSSDEHKSAPAIARGLTVRGDAGGAGPSLRHLHDFGESDGEESFFDELVSKWMIETSIKTVCHYIYLYFTSCH